LFPNLRLFPARSLPGKVPAVLTSTLLVALLVLAGLAEPHHLSADVIQYTYDAAGRLATAVYPNGKVMTYIYDAAGNLLRRSVEVPRSGTIPSFTAADVQNAASNVAGPVAPGEIIVIKGKGLGPVILADRVITPSSTLDSLTGETMVLFDGIAAPLIYALEKQTAAIVPYGVSGTTQIVVSYQGRRSTPVSVPVAGSAPGLFSASTTGTGNGAILNGDSSYNSATNPAEKGSVVQLFGTGEGQTNPAGVDGKVAVSVFPKPNLPVRVSIGGVDAKVEYFGAAPFAVAGLLQVNARIPESVGSGPIPVVLTIGNASSQAGLTVAVK
jgi:uncharacterized protein (TIGR03437 family)